jgi:hypothetical protein
MGVAGGPWLLGEKILSVCERRFPDGSNREKLTKAEVQMAATLDEQPVNRKAAGEPDGED